MARLTPRNNELKSNVGLTVATSTCQIALSSDSSAKNRDRGDRAARPDDRIGAAPQPIRQPQTMDEIGEREEMNQPHEPELGLAEIERVAQRLPAFVRADEAEAARHHDGARDDDQTGDDQQRAQTERPAREN